MAKKRFRHFLFVAIFSLGCLWAFIVFTYLATPNVSHLKKFNPEMTAFMDLYEDPPPLKHEWVPYEKISPYLKQAVVVAEDDRFFEHHGIDWSSIRLAIEDNWKRKEIRRGASTITQQLAKNLYLSPSKNPFRKLKEILIAIKLERSLSKSRILELYLNVVEWGRGIYGAEAASRHYFGKSCQTPSVYQAAWLAAILPNPKFFEAHRLHPSIQRKINLILTRLRLGEAKK